MDTDSALITFKQQVKQNYPDAELYLFGSRARNDHLKQSDYDIIVLSDRFKGINPVRRREQMYLLWDGDKPADILTYTFEEFKQMSSQITIAREAKKDMVRI